MEKRANLQEKYGEPIIEIGCSPSSPLSFVLIAYALCVSLVFGQLVSPPWMDCRGGASQAQALGPEGSWGPETPFEATVNISCLKVTVFR